jgi:hypothetical protein
MHSILLQRKKDALAQLYTGDSIAFRNYLESNQLKIKGQWREAGDKLMKCAEAYYSLKMMLETATLYYDAAECFLRVDKSEALAALRKSVKAYCDIGRFDIAGRIERRIADLHYRILHWEDAYTNYKKAADFFSGDRDLEQSDLCLDRAAECAVQIGKYEEAREMFETIAKSCVNSNLRRFQASKRLLKAIFCLMGKYIYIDDEEPILVTTKKRMKAAKKAAEDKKKEENTNNNTVISPTGGGSVDAMSSLTPRNSFRSDDGNSSIATADVGRHPGGGTSIPPPPPAQKQEPPSKTSFSEADRGRSSLSLDGGSVDNSVTTKTSFQDTETDAGGGTAGNKSLNALSFMGLAEEQIHAKLPRDAVYYHHLPKKYVFEMSETVKLKYTDIEDTMNYYKSIDCLWSCSKEYFFLYNLLKFRKESNYFDFIDHLYHWNNIHPFDDISLILLKMPVQELEKERENKKIAKLNVEVNNAIKTQRQSVF